MKNLRTRLMNMLQNPWRYLVNAEFSRQARHKDILLTSARIDTPEQQPQDIFQALALPVLLPVPPTGLRSMQIETTAHCGYRCFCCASHKAKRRKGVMSREDLSLLVQRVGNFSGKALLHHGGEPLLDKELPEKIGLLRAAWPKAKLVFVSTLGVPVSTEYFDALWKNGLNEIEISCYGYDRETYKAIHGVDKFDLAKNNLCYLLSNGIRMERGGTLRVRMLHMEEHSLVKQAAYSGEAAAFRAMVASHAGVATADTYLSSHSGQGPIKRQRATILPCSVLWGEFGARINVTWDLNIVPCCQDFDNHIVLGNLRHSSLEEIFSSPVYTDFVRASWKNDFSHYPLCQNCERHVQGSMQELLRIFAYGLATFLLKLPEGPEVPFAIIGEARFAPTLNAFFRRYGKKCVSVSRLIELVGQGQTGCLFIAAGGKAQLDYYDDIKKKYVLSAATPLKIVPLNGISYFMKTDLALRMRKIYEDLNCL